MLKGKGIWINVIGQCDNGSMEAIRDKLVKMKADYVIVKAVNGIYGYNYADGVDQVKVLSTYLEPVGIEVAVFAAPYGDAFGVGNWKREVDRIVRRMNEDLPKIKYLILDIEGRWKHENNSAGIASKFMLRLSANMRADVVLGFSSYRYPEQHPQIPYSAFLSYCEINMPQVYWVGQHNSAEQLADCIKQYAAMNYGPADLEFIPAAPAYHHRDDNPPWILEPKDMREFHAAVVDDHKLTSETWWDYESIRSTGFLTVIADLVFEAQPEDPEPPLEAYCDQQHAGMKSNINQLKDANLVLVDAMKVVGDDIKKWGADQVILGEDITKNISELKELIGLYELNLTELRNKVDGMEARIVFLETALSFWKWLGRLLRIAPPDQE